MVELVGTLLAGTTAARAGIALLELNRACAALAWLVMDVLLAAGRERSTEPGPPGSRPLAARTGSDSSFAEQVHEHILREAARREQPPRPPANARIAQRAGQATERPPRPFPFRLSLARAVDRGRDEGFGHPARGEFGLDPEAPGAARAQCPRALLGEDGIPDPA